MTLVARKSSYTPHSSAPSCGVSGGPYRPHRTLEKLSFCRSTNRPTITKSPHPKKALIFKAATILGFHAMLRFGAFCQFNANALYLVLTNGRELRLANTPIQTLPNLRSSLLGIVYRFEPKYTSVHSWGTAYFCHICVVAPPLK